jgi:hypothetical protein
MDGDSDGPANKFIMRGFVVVLESSPSTLVVDEESRMPAHNILQQLPKTESTSQYDSALGSIGAGLHHSRMCRKLGSECRDTGGRPLARNSTPLASPCSRLDFGEASAMKMMTCRRQQDEPVETDSLAKLKSELVAIELWDSDYYRVEPHNNSDEVAYRSRQVRRQEILEEILRIVGADPRAFP